MRVSSLAMSLRAQNTVLNLQNQFSRAQEQVSTGKISQIYSGMRRDHARVSIQLREEIQTKEAYVNSIEQVRTRTKITEVALIGIQDLAEQMRVELINQREGQLDETAPVLKQFADSAIGQLGSLLNTRSEGRYLFNGTNVSTKPVQDAATLKTAAFAAIRALANGNYADVIADRQTISRRMETGIMLQASYRGRPSLLHSMRRKVSAWSTENSRVTIQPLRNSLRFSQYSQMSIFLPASTMIILTWLRTG